ncbi:MAG: hypothetical protein J6K32_05710 [Clostridia bacterium]|nr:hypothetical protein [Clostridia bacterium]
MRAIAFAAALLFAFVVYPLFPALPSLLGDGLRALHARVLRSFTRADGTADERPALCVFLLLLGGACALPGAIHPLLGAVTASFAYTGLSALPGSVSAKEELDSGAYTKDPAAYESLARETCAALAPAFCQGVFAPLLLCALGTPLWLDASLGWCHLALRALCGANSDARRICALCLRPADASFRFLLTLLSGLLGRSPFRMRGKRSGERLMYILGIAGDDSDTHAPMAGDITQAVFLCCFSACLMAGALTFLLMALL